MRPLQGDQADQRAQLRAQKAEREKTIVVHVLQMKRFVVKEDGEFEKTEKSRRRDALRPTLRSNKEPRLRR